MAKDKQIPLALRKELFDTYLDNLLEMHREEAFMCIHNAVEEGYSVPDIYINILQPVMYEVGRLWQVEVIDVATEHYCTAATQLLMAQLFPKATVTKSEKYRMVGCCLGSELHELGLRMVCDCFEFHGWDTTFLGAVTPSKTLINNILHKIPHVVSLSATMYIGVSQIHSIITSLREQDAMPCPVIIVGGQAFNVNQKLYKKVGADGYTSNAIEAVELAYKLVSQREKQNNV